MSHDQNQHTTEPSPAPGKLAPIGATADRQQAGGQSCQPPLIPSKREILLKLNHLPGLVAMGVLTTSRANAMRAVYHTMLSNLDDSSSSGAAIIANDDLVTMLRTQPQLLKTLEPFLTQDQLDLIAREAPNV